MSFPYSLALALFVLSCSSFGAGQRYEIWPGFSINRILNNLVKCDTVKKACEFENKLLPGYYDSSREGPEEGSFVFYQPCKEKEVGHSGVDCVDDERYVAYYNAKFIGLAAEGYGLSIESVLAHEIFHTVGDLEIDSGKIITALKLNKHKKLYNVATGEALASYRFSISTWLCDYIETKDLKSLRKVKYFNDKYVEELGENYELFSMVDWAENPAQYVAYAFHTSDKPPGEKLKFVQEYCKDRGRYVSMNTFSVYAYLDGILMGYVLDREPSRKWKNRVGKGEHMVDILLENVDPLKSEINPLDLSTVRKIELRSKHLENIEEHTQNTEPCIPNYEVEKDKEGVITNINLTCK